MDKKVTFKSPVLPYVLLAPQLIITMLFFIWPSYQALKQSVLQEDPFGLSVTFVGMDNFKTLFSDPLYLESFLISVLFSVLVAFFAMAIALFLAIQADRVVRGGMFYKTFLILPYAIATAVAGVLWMFLFLSPLGVIQHGLKIFGIDWDYVLDASDAFLLVVIAASWKQVAYNFIFFLAGLQAIPKSLIEAASIDGASSMRRFWTIILPLLSPTTFFLLVVNLVYAFFDTFAIIHTVTAGGPAGATNTLVYKVFNDGFIGLNLGGSAAQSVILMIIVMSLTVIQFRYIEKKVHY